MFAKMTFLPLVARILLALLFLVFGIGKIFAFGFYTGYIASKGLPLPQVVLVLTIIVEVGGGVMLVVGYQTRWAAAALAVFTILAAIIFHNYWAAPAAQMVGQKINFFKNLSIAGGMLMLCFFGAGPLSIDKGK
jgi:putative oxidoreductase